MSNPREDAEGKAASDRFLQAVEYLIEWVKHIVTIGSALMVLAIAFLKDLIGETEGPKSFFIAGLLVASYGSMLASIWKSLSLIRFAASCVLTTESQLGKGKELKQLQTLLEHAQFFFLLSFGCFSALAVLVLWIWATGREGSSGHLPWGF